MFFGGDLLIHLIAEDMLPHQCQKQFIAVSMNTNFTFK